MSFRWILAASIVLLYFKGQAQLPQKEIEIKDFYTDELFSISTLTMEDAAARFGNQTEYSSFSMISANAQIDYAVRLIFAPVLQESSQLLSDKTAWNKLSSSQRAWMQRYLQVYNSGVSDIENAVSKYLYERELMQSGKLYWCSIGAPLSASGKLILQQIYSLEKKLAFKTNLQQFKQLRKEFYQQNNKISDAYSADVANIPMKLVDAGLGAKIEIPDPKKQYSLIQKYEQLKLKALECQYNQLQKNWEQNIPEFQRAVLAVSELLNKYAYGEQFSGADKQLIPYLADLQCRCIETSSAIREMAAIIIELASSSQNIKQVNQQALLQLEPYIN